MSMQGWSETLNGIGQLANQATVAASSIGAAASTRRTMKYAAQLQDQYGEAQAQRAYDRQISAWNLQNEYNSPSAQRKRLEAAGLLGASAFAGASPGEAQGLPSVNMGQGSIPASISGSATPGIAAMSELQNMLRTGAEIRNINANTEKTSAQTFSEVAQTGLAQSTTILTSLRAIGQESVNKLSQLDAFIRDQTSPDVISQVKSNVELTKSQLNINKQNLLSIGEDIRSKINKNSLFGVERDSAIQAFHNQVAQLALVEAQTIYHDELSKLTSSQRENLMQFVLNMYTGDNPLIGYHRKLMKSEYRLNEAREYQSTVETDWKPTEVVSGVTTDIISAIAAGVGLYYGGKGVAAGRAAGAASSAPVSPSSALGKFGKRR